MYLQFKYVHGQENCQKDSDDRTLQCKTFSNRGYIREALKEKGVEVEKDDLTKTVKAVRMPWMLCSWTYGCHVLD